MDAKDLRTESTLGERSNDGSSKFAQGMSAMSCNTNKIYETLSSNPLAKVETPTSRPCAVIGPDRIVPPPPTGDVHLKKSHYDPWPPMDNTYRLPPEYPHKMPNYLSPLGNISPRQTFQENMPRIMVQPTYNSKVNDNPNYSLDRNLSKNNKISGPTEPKYCDVPYSVTPISNDQKNSDMCVPNVNNVRNYPQVWHPASVNMRASRPYGTPELYQYSDYASCAGPRPGPMTRPHRTINEETGHVYNDPYYHESNIRYKPYPNIKERYPPTRYDYVTNYTNPFHPPHPFPPYKYDMQKPLPTHPTHSQAPIKYVDNRMPDSVLDVYQRPAQGPYAPPYRNQVIHPTYGPMIGNNLPNKIYPYPTENPMKPVASNKLPFDNKLYVDYDPRRNKGFPISEPFYDMRQHMKNQVIIPSYPATNMQPVHPHLYYRKENLASKNFEYISHLRHPDPSLNTNSLTKLSTQFSPSSIAISPSDSNTSNDTAHTQGGSLEDCGYVSQSSTASIRSVDSGVNRSMQNDFYRRYNYAYSPTVRTSPLTSKPEMTANVGNTKNKEGIDVRQFLQMWNEGDEENAGNQKEVVSQTDYNTNKQLNQYEVAKNHEQLYVLGLMNVPSEELDKYEHIQKVSKLPENIKGYNNIELLKHFEEAIESSNLNQMNQKKSFSRNYHQTKHQLMQALPPRPLSPLDVEAKISQSVIHKEVGCNFEIKPCSPEMLNVQVATPAQNILNERTIEKVTNPLVTKAPMLSSGNANEIMCPVMKENDHTLILNENNKIPSCKMINTECSNSDAANTVKNNYSLQDLESNAGVCLASLPRLDNDIELNFPEVNQQFINANKDSVITITETRIKPNHDHCKAEESGNDFNGTSTTFLTSESEREFSKLSKYRKIKRNDGVVGEKSLNLNFQSIRTDSVIIKNPENTKIIEHSLENQSRDKKRTESIRSNMTLSANRHSPETDDVGIDKDSSNEIAIDFSVNKVDHNKLNELGETIINVSKSPAQLQPFKDRTEVGLEVTPGKVSKTFQNDIKPPLINVQEEFTLKTVPEPVKVSKNSNNRNHKQTHTTLPSMTPLDKHTTSSLLSAPHKTENMGDDCDFDTKSSDLASIAAQEDNETEEYNVIQTPTIQNIIVKNDGMSNLTPITAPEENMTKENNITQPSSSFTTDATIVNSHDKTTLLIFPPIITPKENVTDQINVTKSPTSHSSDDMIVNSHDTNSLSILTSLTLPEENVPEENTVMQTPTSLTSDNIIPSHENTSLSILSPIKSPEANVIERSNVLLTSDNVSSPDKTTISVLHPITISKENITEDDIFIHTPTSLTSENETVVSPVKTTLSDLHPITAPEENIVTQTLTSHTSENMIVDINDNTTLSILSPITTSDEYCIPTTMVSEDITNMDLDNKEIDNSNEVFMVSKENIDLDSRNDKDSSSKSIKIDLQNLVHPNVDENDRNLHCDFKESDSKIQMLENTLYNNVTEKKIDIENLDTILDSVEDESKNRDNFNVVVDSQKKGNMIVKSSNNPENTANDECLTLSQCYPNCPLKDADKKSEHNTVPCGEINISNIHSTKDDNLCLSTNNNSIPLSDDNKIHTINSKDVSLQPHPVGLDKDTVPINDEHCIPVNKDYVLMETDGDFENRNSNVNKIYLKENQISEINAHKKCEKLSSYDTTPILSEVYKNGKAHNINENNLNSEKVKEFRSHGFRKTESDTISTLNTESQKYSEKSDNKEYYHVQLNANNNHFSERNIALGTVNAGDKSSVGINHTDESSKRELCFNKELFSPWIQKLILIHEGKCVNDNIFRPLNCDSGTNEGNSSYKDTSIEDCTLENKSKTVNNEDEFIGQSNSPICSPNIVIEQHNENSCTDIISPCSNNTYMEDVFGEKLDNMDKELLTEATNHDIAVTADSGIFEIENEIGNVELNTLTEEQEYKYIPQTTNIVYCEEDSIEKSLNEMHADGPTQINQNSTEITSVKRCLKRSLSDSALDMFNSDGIQENNSLEDFQRNSSLKKCRKNNNFLNVFDMQNNRRNSISSVYNDENMSFCILIGNNCIISEENEEEENVCYNISEQCFTTAIHDDSVEVDNMESTSEIMLCPQDDTCEYVQPLILEVSDDKAFEETWVDDVACVETVVSDDIAEDIVISAPSSPRDIDESEDDELNVFSNSEHTEKVKYIYGDNMCNDDAELVETLYRTPQMDVNKTLINREPLVSEDCDDYDDTVEDIISESQDKLFDLPEVEGILDDTLKNNLNCEMVELKDVKNDVINDLSTLSSVNSPIEMKTFNYCSNDNIERTQDDVHSCESSIHDELLTFKHEQSSINHTAFSSPEVSSTTTEEKNSTILLKITNYKGTRISHLSDVSLNRCNNSCRFTEKVNYSSYQSDSSKPRPLITKAAQKYIPPPKDTAPNDLKVKLPLPRHSLMKYKQLKISRTERHCNALPRHDILKKPKPKFEDVLKSIDEIQFKKHKEKNRKPNKSVPKVVIKKNENGSHYASTPTKESFNPDLTGRKWQPWVFIEKNIFIDKMATRSKTKAIYNHRKNTYVFADKFKKYKSIPSTKFVISQPRLDDSSSGQFKYTIRLKHSY